MSVKFRDISQCTMLLLTLVNVQLVTDDDREQL
jgi:hypothetical protein